ncbi:carbohydrate-binding protein CenC, partial [Bacillus toyonensis]
MPKATGFLTLIDLNDALISGSAPSNPTTGTLWIDSSVKPNIMKMWDGKSWVVQSLDLASLDKDANDKIENAATTLSNLADDSKIDITERSYVKDKLANIIGSVLPDTANTLPIATTLDSGGKGEFYSVRKQAINIGIPTSDTNYIAVATQYTNLKTYLEALTPIDAWDTSIGNKDKVIQINPTVWRDTWLKYYQSIDVLSEAIQAKAKNNVDEQTSGGS